MAIFFEQRFIFKTALIVLIYVLMFIPSTAYANEINEQIGSSSEKTINYSAENNKPLDVRNVDLRNYGKDGFKSTPKIKDVGPMTEWNLPEHLKPAPSRTINGSNDELVDDTSGYSNNTTPKPLPSFSTYLNERLQKEGFKGVFPETSRALEEKTTPGSICEMFVDKASGSILRVVPPNGPGSVLCPAVVPTEIYDKILFNLDTGTGYGQDNQDQDNPGILEPGKLGNEGANSAPVAIEPNLDKDQYVGEYKNGLWHGTGTWISSSGHMYEGQFRYGIRHGMGTYKWPSGHKYVGEFREGLRNGKGTYTWPNGHRYVGEFKNSARHGAGVYNWPSGARYGGQFYNGVRHGNGTYTYPNGKTLRGRWENGSFIG